MVVCSAEIIQSPCGFELEWLFNRNDSHHRGYPFHLCSVVALLVLPFLSFFFAQTEQKSVSALHLSLKNKWMLKYSIFSYWTVTFYYYCFSHNTAERLSNVMTRRKKYQR